MALVRGTCISMNGQAVLLRGPSGAGKSDVALRLIDEGAKLVADDNTEVTLKNNIALASPPKTVAGLLEVRGLGIMTLPHETGVPLALVVDFVAREDVPRMPGKDMADIAGIQVTRLSLHAFDASTPAKIRLALTQKSA